jgi:DNA-binding CsgD family transcriptional regulator
MEGGDKAGIVVWAEDRTGHKPHSRVRVHLTGEELEESTPAETFELVDVWGARSEGRGKVHDLERRLPQIRGGIKKFASVEQALATLALEGQSREHALQDNLLGMAYELEAPALSDAKLGGKIASQIRREVCERTPTRSEELQQLAEFVDHEAFVKQELERGRKAGLPPRELEVYKLCVENPGIKNREVAAKLGISVGTVGALKSRIKKTLNTA